MTCFIVYGRLGRTDEQGWIGRNVTDWPTLRHWLYLSPSWNTEYIAYGCIIIRPLETEIWETWQDVNILHPFCVSFHPSVAPLVAYRPTWSHNYKAEERRLIIAPWARTHGVTCNKLTHGERDSRWLSKMSKSPLELPQNVMRSSDATTLAF